MGQLFKNITKVLNSLKFTKMSEHLETQLTKIQSALTGDTKKRHGDINEDISDAKKSKVEDDGQSKRSGLPYKKKKVAMMLVYSGKDYVGMQRNPGVQTIESELLLALVKGGVVTQDHANEPNAKMKFQRAARTDKGVSAAGQVCSLKMFVDVENPVEKINAHLPKDIRILSIKRATQGFDCKNAADARTYLYFIPTFAFAPITEFVKEDYRLNDEILQKVNDLLLLYKGTHNFHNFTSGKKPTDPSATRYIMSFNMGKPFEMDGLEFAEIKVKGQSFMLHQIRKMIGLTIAIVRGITNTDSIELCWGPEKVDVPKAPGLGLMLDRLHYDHYNKKFAKDGSHEALEWDHLKDEIEKFKSEFIFKTIVDTEKEEKSMMKWMETLHFHNITPSTEKTTQNTGLYKANKNIVSERLSEELKNSPEEKKNIGIEQTENSTDVKNKIEQKLDGGDNNLQEQVENKC